MSEKKEIDARSLLEQAMDRAAGEAPDAAAVARSADPRLGRRDYDKALLRRHEQLRIALGGEDVPAAVPPPTLNVPSIAGRGRAYARGTLVLTSVVSALCGAGLMWLAIGAADHSGVVAPMLPAVVERAAPAPTATALPVAASLPAGSGERQLRDLVERWRQAWASRDVEAYLACYRPDFVAADGQTGAGWAAARRRKLSSQSELSVQVHDLRIERIDGDQAKAVFLQDYAAGPYRESARPKTLLLVRTGGDWRIAGEWQGTPPPAPVGRK